MIVGWSPPSHFLSQSRCSTSVCKLCVLPVGNKVKRIYSSREPFIIPTEKRTKPEVARNELHGADGCLKQENREIAKEKFSSENFQARKRTFKFQESVARGRVVTAEKS